MHLMMFHVRVVLMMMRAFLVLVIGIMNTKFFLFCQEFHHFFHCTLHELQCYIGVPDLTGRVLMDCLTNLANALLALHAYIREVIIV